MKRVGILMLLSLFFICLTQVFAEESIEVKINRAMSAAPVDISSKATIMDVDGKILREGSNGWTCLPGISLIPGDNHPMCNDETWMRWMKAVAEDKPFSTDVIGVSYMLQGDALVNNENPGAKDPKMDKGTWIQEGPHIMLLMPNYKMLDKLPRNPYLGGPYVMWDNTSMVHVMLPLDTKE